MIRRFTFWSLLPLFFLCGCAGQVYFFPADRGPSGTAQKTRQQQEAVVSELFSPAGSTGAEEEAPALAGLEDLEIEEYQPPAEARALARHLSGTNVGTNKGTGLTHLLGLVKKKKREEQETLPKAEKKPAGWSWAGLVLSLLGLATLVLGLALLGLQGSTLPILFSLGFLAAVLGTVFSGLAMSKMKKQSQNRKDWKAIAGFILGYSTVGLYLALFLTYLALLVLVKLLLESIY